MLYLQGCSSGSQSRDPAAIRAAVLEARAEEQQLIRTTIQDARRLDNFLVLLDRRDEALRIYVAEIEEYRRDFELLNADYAAQRTDFEKLVSRFNQQRAIAQQDLIGLVEAMKRSTTPEEWQVIAKFQTERLDPRRLAYDGGLTEER